MNISAIAANAAASAIASVLPKSTATLDLSDIAIEREVRERYRGVCGRDSITLKISGLYRLFGEHHSDLTCILQLDVGRKHTAVDGTVWERIA